MAHTVYWKIQTTVQRKKYLRKYLNRLFFPAKTSHENCKEKLNGNIRRFHFRVFLFKFAQRLKFLFLAY